MEKNDKYINIEQVDHKLEDADFCPWESDKVIKPLS